MRLWPRSMLGQVLLAVGLTLLVAQCVSAVLLLKAAETRRDNAVMNAAAFQLVRQAEPREAFEFRRRGMRGEGPGMRAGPLQIPRPVRLEWTGDTPLAATERRDAGKESELSLILQSQGVAIDELVVTERRLLDDPYISGRPRLVARIREEGREHGNMLVVGLKRTGASQWAVARVPQPPVARGVHRTIVFQTLLIFVLLVGLLTLLIRRITRPLGALADRTESFTGSAHGGEPLAERGPEDVQRLIRAHNGMERRIAALLDEKDVMLGAIGHDLKTPLAALRVRIESVADEAQRDRMAASIEDITRTLDDILSLARVGRANSLPEKTDLSALAASVVEEFEDMGKPVELGEVARIARPVHLTWLKRALRNLVSNAVRYGGGARVSVVQDGDVAILRVEDEGPGIPEGRIADMLEPFQRGEASRNRATGGAGLGLTLARAIAEQHRGELRLTNREQGGLVAEIRLPK